MIGEIGICLGLSRIFVMKSKKSKIEIKTLTINERESIMKMISEKYIKKLNSSAFLWENLVHFEALILKMVLPSFIMI